MREEVMREEKEDDWCSIAGCSIAGVALLV